MAFNITPINVAADTFQVWVNRTNECINALNTSTISANSSATGSTTTGNAYMNGIFTAVTLVAFTAIRGGTVAVSNTLDVISVLQVSNTSNYFGNVRITGAITDTQTLVANVAIRGGNTTTEGQLSVYSNVYITNVATFSTMNVTTTGTAAQLIDSFLLTLYRAGDYTISIKDNTANNYQTQKITALYDGSSIDIVEYGVLYSNVSAGSFSANANATHARIYFTPVSANTTVKGIRVSINN